MGEATEVRLLDEDDEDFPVECWACGGVVRYSEAYIEIQAKDSLFEEWYPWHHACWDDYERRISS